MTQEIRYQINGWPEKTIHAGTAPSRGPGTSPEAVTEPPLQIRVAHAALYGSRIRQLITK